RAWWRCTPARVYTSTTPRSHRTGTATTSTSTTSSAAPATEAGHPGRVRSGFRGTRLRGREGDRGGPGDATGPQAVEWHATAAGSRPTAVPPSRVRPPTQPRNSVGRTDAPTHPWREPGVHRTTRSEGANSAASAGTGEATRRAHRPPGQPGSSPAAPARPAPQFNRPRTHHP